jgi:hypothetical protein
MRERMTYTVMYVQVILYFCTVYGKKLDLNVVELWDAITNNVPVDVLNTPSISISKLQNPIREERGIWVLEKG